MINQQKKEQKICSYQQKGIRLQLVMIMYFNNDGTNTWNSWQIRKNRKILLTTNNEYGARKQFAVECQLLICQLKII